MNSNNYKDNDEPSSPLKSMATTATTLAVRQSHIGVTNHSIDQSNYPDNFEMVQEYRKSAMKSSHNQVNEIVQYPPDVISTSFQRSNVTNWGYQSGKTILKQLKSKENAKNKLVKKDHSTEYQSFGNKNSDTKQCNG